MVHTNSRGKAEKRNNSGKKRLDGEAGRTMAGTAGTANACRSHTPSRRRPFHLSTRPHDTNPPEQKTSRNKRHTTPAAHTHLPHLLDLALGVPRLPLLLPHGCKQRVALSLLGRDARVVVVAQEVVEEVDRFVALLCGARANTGKRQRLKDWRFNQNERKNTHDVPLVVGVDKL